MNESILSDEFLAATEAAPETRRTIAKAVLSKTSAAELLSQLVSQLKLERFEDFSAEYSALQSFVFYGKMYHPLKENHATSTLSMFAFLALVDRKKMDVGDSVPINSTDIALMLFD